MIMADVFTVVFLFLGFWIAIPALCLMLRGFWPRIVERSRHRVSKTPWRCFFAGLLVGIPGFVAVAGLGSLGGAGGGMALVLTSALILYAFFGYSGLATHLGERLGSPKDAERPWLATVRGAVCLEIASSIPVLGWFLVFPVALVVGAGATTVALVVGEEPQLPPAHTKSVEEPSPVSTEIADELETVGAA